VIDQHDVAANGLTFSVRSAGPADGRPVLLLHGFPQNSWCWRSQLDVLGDAGYRAVAPDQRGYSAGARPVEVADYAAAHLVADVVALAEPTDIRIVQPAPGGGTPQTTTVPVAAGTDAPFGPADPWEVMRAAVSRTTRSGAVLGSDEAISAPMALSMFLGSPDRPSIPRSVVPGSPGDLCILKVPLERALEELSASNVAATVIEGLLIAGPV